MNGGAGSSSATVSTVDDVSMCLYVENCVKLIYIIMEGGPGPRPPRNWICA